MGVIYNTVLENPISQGDLIDLQVILIDENTGVINLENESVKAQLLVDEFKQGSENLLNAVSIGQWIEVLIGGNVLESSLISCKINFSKNLHLEPKEFCDNLILKIHDENKSLIPRKLKGERKQLDRLIGELSKEDLTFLFELIQNAIDHPLSKDGVSMRFEIMGDYLLFSHDGAPFIEKNFISITGIMHGEDDDEGNTRIGYKGIGFKSIFKYTNEVIIKSGNYNFSFSKSKTGSELPWEIFPILELESSLYEELPNFHFLNSNVGFAFKFINDNLKLIAQNFLHLLIEESESILFLKKLRKLTIITEEGIKTLSRSIIIKDDFTEVTIHNKNQESKWIIVEQSEKIEDLEVIAELKDEEKRIPSKYREFRQPTIQIAYPLEEKKNLKNLYTYLPLTKTNFGLPFIINGDFIPDLDRNDLVNLIYNERLGKLSSKVHVQLINVLGREFGNDLALRALNVLNHINNNGFWNEHFQSLKRIINEIVINGEKLTNTIIDTSCLFQIIDIEYSRFDDEIKYKNIISDLSIENKRLLIDDFDFEEFKLENACSFLNISEVQEKLFDSYVQVVKFLKSLNTLPNAKDWQRKFSADVLLYPKGSDPSIKVPLREVTYGLNSNFYTVVSYNLKDQLILDLEDKILGENIKTLLSDFSLMEVDKVLLINTIYRKRTDFIKYIENNLENKEIIKNYIVNVWSFLYESKGLKNNDQNFFYVNTRFDNYPILTNDGAFLNLLECSLSEKGEISEEVVQIYNWVGLSEINVINSEPIAENLNISISEFNKFLITISPNIKNTDGKLLQNFIKEVSKNNFQRIKDLDFEIQFNLLNSIAKIFNKHIENPINIDLANYPVITKSGCLRPINQTYLAIPSNQGKEETLAQKLFRGIDGVDFISEEYYNKSTLSTDELSQFLYRFGLSAGLKLTSSNVLKDKYKFINLLTIDNEFEAFNSSRPSFQTPTTFSIINDLPRLSGKNENLKIFWKEVLKSENWDLIRPLSIGNIQVDNPLVFLLKKQNLALFPMKDGNAANQNMVLNKPLEELVFSDKYKLDFEYKSDNNLLKKIRFSSDLNLDQTINVFNNIEKLDNEKLKRFIDLVITTKWDSTDFEKLKVHIRLPDKNQSIRDSNELVYLDRSFQNGIIDTSRSDFPNNKIAFEFDYKESYKAFIDRIGMKSFSFNDVTVKRVVVSRSNTRVYTSDMLIQVLKGLSEPKINEETFVFFSEMLLKPCEDIEIHIAEVPEISEVVQAFIDEKEKIIYFKDEWNLAEILAIKLELSSSPARKLRNRLIEFSITTSDKYEIESTVEISESKVLNDGEKNEPRIELKDPYEKLGLTGEEVQEMERLLKRKLSNEEMENQSIVALFKGLNYYEELGFDLSYSRSNIDEILRIKYLKNIKANDNVFNSIVRSGANGILYLKYNAWIDFQKENFELAILKDNKENSFEIIKNIQSLSELTEKDTWIIQLNSNEKTTDIQALFNGDLVKDNSKKYTELTILIRLPGNKDFSKIFDNISVPNNYATNQNDIQ
jgi:hypothetical protein